MNISLKPSDAYGYTVLWEHYVAGSNSVVLTLIIQFIERLPSMSFLNDLNLSIIKMDKLCASPTN